MSNEVLELPVIKFKGDNYKVNELTIGALLDIESMKATLTNGYYGEIISHKTIISNWNLDIVDMFANLMVLVPEMVEKGLVAKNWRDMSPIDTMELKKEYDKNFLPWLENRLSFLSPPKEEKEQKKDS